MAHSKGASVHSGLTRRGSRALRHQVFPRSAVSSSACARAHTELLQSSACAAASVRVRGTPDAQRL
eukprot:6197240-Alexandrium_andersonii.AAC.1